MVDGIEHHIHLLSGKNLFKFDFDGILRRAIGGHFVEFGQQGVVRIAVDQLDLDILVFFEQFGQMFGSHHAAVTAAQNDYLFQETHLLVIEWKSWSHRLYFACSSALVTRSK
ncbi:hypothetical protein D1872_244430 [compost metagenome]